jgi:transposase
MAKLTPNKTAVAIATGVCRNTVSNVINRFEEAHEDESRPMKARKKILTDADLEYMELQIRREENVSLDDLRKALDKPVSVRTIRRRLLEDRGLRLGPEPKFQHTDPHVQSVRLAWAKEHKNWTVDQWKNVLFTDEKQFPLRYYGKRSVWKDSAGRVVHPMSTGGIPAHITTYNFWGCFGGFEFGLITLAGPTLNAQGYIALLEGNLEDSEALAPTHLYAQDNAPIHTAHSVRQWFDDRKVHLLSWPPYSPDLNPIENLWHIINENTRDRDPKTPQELEAVLKDAWAAAKDKYWPQLIASMPARCQRVIREKGRPIGGHYHKKV